MTEPLGVSSFEDILYDEEGTRKRAALIERYASDRGSARRPSRDLGVRPKNATAAPAPAGPKGEELVARRPAELRARYRTLFSLESHFGADFDYGFLIASACQVLEAELSALLTAPARSVGDRLVAALQRAGKAKQAEILRGWADGQQYATIGTASLVLLGLRYALEAGDEECRAFLERHFRPGYLGLLRTREFGATLDRLREKFRNPACHGTEVFDHVGYQQFARFAVARGRFGDWAAEGPQLDGLPAASALLHHHLAESLLLEPAAPEPPTATERLLALARPRQSRLCIQVEPERADTPVRRDISVGPPRLGRPFRLGDGIRFVFQAGQDCEVALIDIGTSGTVAVVLPNAFAIRAAVRGGQVCRLPDPTSADFEFTLQGRPGRERVVALAWTGTLPVALAPEGDAAFRVLSPAELRALCDALERMEGDRWAACVAEFEITSDQGAS